MESASPPTSVRRDRYVVTYDKGGNAELPVDDVTGLGARIMEAMSSLIKVSIPNYLRDLPLPTTLSGFARLSGGDWLSLVPFVGTVSLLVYVTVQAFKPPPPKKDGPINPKIQKESAKVVNMVDIEDLGDKVCYCRCWRSKKFPLCDGSHTKHNETTGDNVGPLVLKKRNA